MMHGITVKNTVGHLLISSEFECMHCAGAAQFVSTIASGLTSLPNYGGYSLLNGRHIHRYAITGNPADPPMFFIKPTAMDESHGILNQWSSSNQWYVDVLQTGATSQPPIVLAFMLPSAMPASGQGYGIATFLPNGRLAFDSRLRPLAIYHAQSVVPPAVPCNGGTPQSNDGYSWNNSTLDFDFNCNNKSNRYDMPATVTQDNLMFSAPCTAQAVYSRKKYGFKRSCSTYGGCQDHWSTACWWAMYHQAYRVNTGSVIAGWGMYAAGYWFTSNWEDGSGFLGTGLFGGGGGSTSTGAQPYADKTINLSENTIIVADARYYL